jgi:hypothetical protein
VPTPAVGTSGNNLFLQVTSVGSNLVWAVGYRFDSNGPQPLVERWNGTAWRVESTPALALGGSLYGASSVLGSGGVPTVWGVGIRSDFVNGAWTDRTLTMQGVGS